MAQAVQGSLGEVALHDGRPRDALELLNRALDGGPAQVDADLEAAFYGARSQARAQLGDYKGAFGDASTLLQSREHSHLLSRDLGEIAVTRTKFDAAMQEQQQLRAGDAARSAEQQATRRLFERSVMMLSLLPVLAMSVFLMWAQRRRQDIERAARSTEERMSTMSRVTGGIAHDFNNQLTVMMQASGLLANHASIASDPSAQSLLQAIRQAGAACAHVTAQMLSFSRQQNLHPEPVRLGAWLATLRPAIEHLAGPDVALRIEVAAPEPVAYVDPRQLEAALMNLVSNARDATPQGGAVLIRARAGGSDQVRIAVLDRGPGMSPQVLARATEPFFSTKPVGEGSGLGLSMVHGFATQSGGSLSLTSEAHRGTCAELILPATREQA